MVPSQDRLGSSGLAVIVAEEATEPFTTFDRGAVVRGLCLGERDDVGEPLVVSLRVKMLHVLGDQVPQVALAERHDPIEALLLNRAHPALGERVQIWTR